MTQHFPISIIEFPHTRNTRDRTLSNLGKIAQCLVTAPPPFVGFAINRALDARVQVGSSRSVWLPNVEGDAYLRAPVMGNIAEGPRAIFTRLAALKCAEYWRKRVYLAAASCIYCRGISRPNETFSLRWKEWTRKPRSRIDGLMKLTTVAVVPEKRPTFPGKRGCKQS